MLPFVLGGIAVAAAGYTIKRALQDDMFRNDLEDKIMAIGDWFDDLDAKLTAPSDDPFPSTMTSEMLKKVHDLGRTDLVRQTAYETSLKSYFDRCGKNEELATCEPPKKVPLTKLMLTTDEMQTLRFYSALLAQAAQGLDDALQALNDDPRTCEQADAYAKLVCQMLRAKILNKSNDIHPKLGEKIIKFARKLDAISKKF